MVWQFYVCVAVAVCAATEGGPVTSSLIGGANGEVAFAYSGAVLAAVGNPNSVTATSLLDATSGSRLMNGAIFSVQGQNLQALAISVYNGPQGTDTGGTVLADGDVLLGGSVASSDGSNSVGFLSVLDTTLNYTDGTTAMIQYPQLTAITALALYASATSLDVYLLGAGPPSTAAHAARLSPAQPPEEPPFFICSSFVKGEPCLPPLNWAFQGKTVDLSSTRFQYYFAPQGVVGDGYAMEAFIENAPGVEITSYTVVGNLPPGLSATNSNEYAGLSGIPTQDGTFPVTFRAVDSRGCSASITEPITVRPRVSPSIFSASLSGKALEITGTGFLKSESGGGKPTILINGAPIKTKPGPMGADTDLIAPKGGNRIPVGATATIQVRLPDGSLTNSIVIRRSQ